MIILYADLTEKFPRFSPLHAQKSPTFLVQSGIDKMASPSMGTKTERTNCSFQDAVTELINSDTYAGGLVISEEMGLIIPGLGSQL